MIEFNVLLHLREYGGKILDRCLAHWTQSIVPCRWSQVYRETLFGGDRKWAIDGATITLTFE